jgi:uncharacterized membrane-anchored protein
MALLPTDDPERLILADEVHARPPEPVETPSRASYVAVRVEPEQRGAEFEHLRRLCADHAVEPPPEGATHFSAPVGSLRLKWERHGEFSSYTMLLDGLDPQAFGAPAAAALPSGWLAAIPGHTVFAAHAQLMLAGSELPDPALLSAHFGSHFVLGSDVADGAGYVFTDFRIHGDGFSRFLIYDRHFTQRQAGRTLQRLFEIEAYRMMALLALPIARQLLPRVVQIERALAALTADIARDDLAKGSRDEALLHELTRLAAEVESGLAASQFRFGACRAYGELVVTRIHELRERRLPGLQTIEEFMARRFLPAVGTCATTSQRLHELSERVAQASALLSTRVSIARERQNQALLASMDRRARLQLRLQQTVETLSVAAIVYYVAGVIGYLARGGRALGLTIDYDLVVGLAIPVVAVLVLLAIRRARRRLRSEDEEAQTSLE